MFEVPEWGGLVSLVLLPDALSLRLRLRAGGACLLDRSRIG